MLCAHSNIVVGNLWHSRRSCYAVMLVRAHTPKLRHAIDHHTLVGWVFAACRVVPVRACMRERARSLFRCRQSSPHASRLVPCLSRSLCTHDANLINQRRDRCPLSAAAAGCWLLPGLAGRSVLCRRRRRRLHSAIKAFLFVRRAGAAGPRYRRPPQHTRPACSRLRTITHCRATMFE